MNIEDFKKSGMDVTSVPKVVAYIVFTALMYMAQQNVASMSQTLKSMQEDLSDLNKTMAVVVVNQSSLKKTTDDHEQRIRFIEKLK